MWIVAIGIIYLIQGTTFVLSNVLSRQQNIADLGYPDCGAGWYDVQGQGVKNDYCRWNNHRGHCSFWSCALAGSNVAKSSKGQFTEPETSSLRARGILGLGTSSLSFGKSKKSGEKSKKRGKSWKDMSVDIDFTKWNSKTYNEHYGNWDKWDANADSSRQDNGNGRSWNTRAHAGNKVLSRQQNIADLGYPDCGAGWYDVQGQGVKNDYCRWVGNCGCRGHCSFWSCALAGSNVAESSKGQFTEPVLSRQQNIADLGYPDCGAGWYDVQGQGVKNDYCRWVGNCGCRGHCSFWSCALAGSNVAKSSKGQFTEPETSSLRARGILGLGTSSLRFWKSKKSGEKSKKRGKSWKDMSVDIDFTKWNSKTYNEHYGNWDKWDANADSSRQDNGNGRSWNARAHAGNKGLGVGAFFDLKEHPRHGLGMVAGVQNNWGGIVNTASAGFEVNTKLADGHAKVGGSADASLTSELAPGVGVGIGIGTGLGLDAGLNRKDNNVGLSAQTPVGDFGAHLGCKNKVCIFACVYFTVC